MLKKNLPIPPGIHLSLCMIVKNEEENLSACLESVKDIVDEMIILDTGSKDNTVKIAEEYGANILHFKWCEDFSAARNESIKFASGKWILWMDADEQFDENSKEELKTILNLTQHPMGVKVTIKNFSSNNVSYGNAYRLFSNHCGISFKNIVHEQVSYSLKEIKAEIVDSNIVINHFGYDESKFDQEKKRVRNLPLLKKMSNENPDDFLPQFLLGKHYSGEDHNQGKAIYHLEKFLQMNSREIKLIASAYTTLGDIYLSQNEIIKAKFNVEKSLEVAPSQMTAYYLLGRIESDQKQFEKAVEHLEELLENMTDSGKFKSDNALDTVFNRNHIAGFISKIMLFHLNEKKSLELIEKIWKTCGDYSEMSQIFYEWNDLDKEKFIQLTTNKGESESHWKILNEISGFLHLMKNDYQGALPIFQNLFDKNHRNTFTIRSLAGIHAKMGRMDEAETLLKSLL